MNRPASRAGIPQAGSYPFAGCEAFDFNASGAIDLLDMSGFQRLFPPP
jgi:hypothetical protein